MLNINKYAKERGKVMLRTFRCKNCYSFKEETVLSMIASESDIHDEFLFQPNGQRIIRVMSIYGANASGKSNLLRAVCDMLDNIVAAPLEIEGEPFLLDDTLEPMLSEFEVFLDNKIYKYGYTATDEGIVDEWLLAKDISSFTDYSPVFTRKGTQLNYNDSNKAIEGLIPTLNQSNETLFLHLAGKTSISPFCDIYKWCKSAVNVMPRNIFDENFKKHMKSLGDEESKRRLLCFLQKFDPTIANFSVKDIGNSTKYMPVNISISRSFVNDGKKVAKDFPFFMESAGTQKIFMIYFSILSAIEENSLLIADEFDFKLHPWIVREVLKLFHSNTTNAQILFSAHGTACLNGQDLRMDEVSFVEKDMDGCSSILRLELLNGKGVNPDTDFGKYYLAGQLGAVPTHFKLEEQNEYTL